MAQIDGTFLPGEGAIVSVRIAVSQAFEDWLTDTGQPVPAPEAVFALIDPGAEDTLVSPDVIARLGLSATGKALVIGISGKPGFYPEYDVRLIFPGGASHTITAVAAPVSYRSAAGQLVECCIGCNLLARGTFLYDGPRGQFRLTI